MNRFDLRFAVTRLNGLGFFSLSYNPDGPLSSCEGTKKPLLDSKIAKLSTLQLAWVLVRARAFVDTLDHAYLRSSEWEDKTLSEGIAEVTRYYRAAESVVKYGASYLASQSRDLDLLAITYGMFDGARWLLSRGQVQFGYVPVEIIRELYGEEIAVNFKDGLGDLLNTLLAVKGLECVVPITDDVVKSATRFPLKDPKIIPWELPASFVASGSMSGVPSGDSNYLVWKPGSVGLRCDVENGALLLYDSTSTDPFQEVVSCEVVCPNCRACITAKALFLHKTA